MARLVNKQFNSPIGLYSEQNIREVIQRDSQLLANGAVGVNFNNPGVGKPANLQNSAVLRMLEEEEQRQRSGKSPSIKRVAWPPPSDEANGEQQAIEGQGGLQYSSQSPNLQNNRASAQQQAAREPSHRYPLKPLDISNGTANCQPSSFSPTVNPSPVGYRPVTPNKQWAPVHSPVSSPGQPLYNQPELYQQSPFQQHQFPTQQYQIPVQQYQSPPQQYQNLPREYQIPVQQYQPPREYQIPVQQYQPPQQYQQNPIPQNQFVSPPPQQLAQSVAAPIQVAQRPQASEPPPATITLRQQAPVSQASPPVVTSQPATATLKGGKNLRGDLKWPPENVKLQVEEENRQRIQLAKGPAFRPRAVKKDYGPFFAQHALNSSYPGYKAPPGTQFYDNRAF